MVTSTLDSSNILISEREFETTSAFRRDYQKDYSHHVAHFSHRHTNHDRSPSQGPQASLSGINKFDALCWRKIDASGNRRGVAAVRLGSTSRKAAVEQLSTLHQPGPGGCRRGRGRYERSRVTAIGSRWRYQANCQASRDPATSS